MNKPSSHGVATITAGLSQTAAKAHVEKAMHKAAIPAPSPIAPATSRKPKLVRSVRAAPVRTRRAARKAVMQLAHNAGAALVKHRQSIQALPKRGIVKAQIASQAGDGVAAALRTVLPTRTLKMKQCPKRKAKQPRSHRLVLAVPRRQ